MKLKNVLLLAGMLACVDGFAQVKGFDVAEPEWKRIVVSTTDGGVNIRKLPSSTAPKLVYNENGIDDFQAPLSWFGYWSSKPAKSPVYPVTFSGYGILVSEKSGWYEVKDIGPKCNTNGWVSGKYCRAITPTPMTPASNPDTTHFKWLNNETSHGAYGLYFIADECEGEAVFYLGRLADGKLICPYSFKANLVIDGEKYKIIYDDQMNTYSFVCPMYTDDSDLSKIGHEIIKVAMDNMKKNEGGYTFVVCLIDGQLATFTY